MPEQQDPKLGINSWLEEELYQTYLHDRKYVDETWKQVFERNGHSAPAPAGNGSKPSPAPSNGVKAAPAPPSTAVSPDDQVQPLRGVAGKIAENMTASISVPTATSQRIMPVRVLDENRQLINEQRALTGKSKISYTHLIGWAIMRALEGFRSINDAYSEQNGEPVSI
ncbi:MAG TPA: 2-oxo acid dehydrogenase subunit E2, partial [Bryobacteraceae bacterium]|nr:2-oxo acid dehydrogenase subunit E2 [Bryobacteraceae bacterium]